MSKKADLGLVAAGRAIAPLVNENLRLRAVNADLMAALEKIKGRDSAIDASPSGKRRVRMGELAHIADAALAKARGDLHHGEGEG